MAVRGRGARRPEQHDEIKVIGFRAALALAERRPDDVVRGYLAEDRVRPFSRLLERLAARKIAYHVVGDEELDRVAGSMHHEGVCLMARPRPPATLAGLVKRARDEDPAAMVYLDRVENPNNVGAIVRVLAHFAAPALLYAAADPRTFRSSAVARTAEGGSEYVDLFEPPDPLAAIRALQDKAGLTVIATSGYAETSLYEIELPRRALFLFGAEAEGLSQPLLDAADHVVSIPGSGWVESLNVACAATAVLAEHARLHR